MQQTARKTYRNVRVTVIAVYNTGVFIVDGWDETKLVSWEHIEPGRELFAGFRGQIGIETQYADGEGLFA